MRPVTQIIVDDVLPPMPPPTGTEVAVPSPPELESKHGGTPKTSGRMAKRTASPSPGRKIIRGQPRALALPEISESGNSAGSDLVIRDEHPWDTFKKYYECDLAGTVAVCVRRSDPRAAWAIREYPSKDANRVLQILRCVRHENVLSVLECFRTPDFLYTLSKFHPLTLDHVVACKAFPDQQQLAAIMSQFLDGLSYLITQNLQHASLGCSSILMNLDGKIQIARLECCSFRPSGKFQTSDMAPVARVMMELMQKYVKDDRAVGIDNLNRWPTNSATVEFLSATTSAGSFEELKMQHLLTEFRWSTGDLIGLAWFTLISARTFYSYTPGSDGDE